MPILLSCMGQALTRICSLYYDSLATPVVSCLCEKVTCLYFQRNPLVHQEPCFSSKFEASHLNHYLLSFPFVWNSGPNISIVFKITLNFLWKLLLFESLKNILIFNCCWAFLFNWLAASFWCLIFCDACS